MSSHAVRDSFNVVLRFFRHPMDEIARLPDWRLFRMSVTLFVVAGFSGLLAGLLPPGLWRLLQGMILFPILAIVMSALLASFFYYFFQIFENRSVSYTRLFTLVGFANFPFYLFHIGSNVFPLTDVLGLALSAILLVIGLTENFALEKRRSLRVVGLIFGLLFLLWLAEKISQGRAWRDAGVQTQSDF